MAVCVMFITQTVIASLQFSAFIPNTKSLVNNITITIYFSPLGKHSQFNEIRYMEKTDYDAVPTLRFANKERDFFSSIVHTAY